MNRLILIGNGFDLAHGLKTSYEDFISYYLKDRVYRKSYSDELIEVKNDSMNPIPFSDDLNTFIQNISAFNKNNLGTIKYLDLFDSIISRSRWVDIEYGYFEKIKGILRALKEKPNRNPKSMMLALNSQFDRLKLEFENYLGDQIKISKNLRINRFQSLFQKGLVKSDRKRNKISNLIFVNFNYTNTLDLYLKALDHESYDIKVINIHGSTNDEENPVIFGFGDEHDSTYKEIEDLNEDEFFKNIKSFGYQRNEN